MRHLNLASAKRVLTPLVERALSLIYLFVNSEKSNVHTFFVFI
jgi:hypothetical protein